MYGEQHKAASLTQRSAYVRQRTELAQLKVENSRSNLEKGYAMNRNLIRACCIAAALMLPAAGHSADSDADRSSPKTFVKDAVITAKIKAKLAKAKMSSLANVSVDTDKRGVVSLSGTVKTKEDRTRAASIARGVKGVTSVNNSIQVKAD